MNTYDGYNITFQTMGNLRKVNPAIAARALSRIARFGGHTRAPISVLTHSFGVAKAAARISYVFSKPSASVKRALAHDAAECIMGEIPRPFKTQEQRKVEKRIQRQLFIGWNLEPICKRDARILKELDDDCGTAEAKLYGAPNAEELQYINLNNTTQQSTRWAWEKCPWGCDEYLFRAFSNIITCPDPILYIECMGD